MSPIASFLLFLAVSSTLVGGWHYYLWHRLVKRTSLAGPWRSAVSIAIVTLAVALPVCLALGRSLRLVWMRPLLAAVYSWMAAAFLILVALLLGDLLRLAGWTVRKLTKTAPLDEERRRALSRLIGGTAAMVGLGGTGYGITVALGPIGVERLKIKLPKLPKSLKGTTIVQLTDLHVGPTLRRNYVQSVVDQVNALSPDIVAITGDLVDGKPSELLAEVAPLRDLRTRYGVFFVTGNHEYYAGVAAWMDALAGLGVRVLRNERVTIGTPDAAFDLAGVDDYSSGHRDGGHGSDVAGALAGRDLDREVVLLAHQPRSIWEAAKHGVSLQLSGHTHGGQVFPWTLFVLLQQPFVTGLHKVGDTLLYVSRGTGFWGPPVRLGAPPEITLIELE